MKYPIGIQSFESLINDGYFPNKEVAEGFIKYLVPYYMPIKDSESVY